MSYAFLVQYCDLMVLQEKLTIVLIISLINNIETLHWYFSVHQADGQKKCSEISSKLVLANLDLISIN